MPPFESKKISIKGRNLLYVDPGLKNSIPVILLHAFPLSHQMWAHQLEALSTKYRVIAYDIGGFGGSTTPTEEPSIDSYCQELFGLMDTLDVPRAVLAGLSMGGYIALRAKQLSPERFEALVIADSKTDPDTEEGRKKRFDTVKKIQGGGLKEFADGFLASALSKGFQETQKKEVETLRQVILSNSPAGICTALKAMAGRSDTSSALTQNKIPTLLIVGKEDSITPPEVTQKMKGAYPEAEICLIEKAGHLSCLENPKEFNDCLLHFLNNQFG